MKTKKIGLFYGVIIALSFLAFLITYYQKYRTPSLAELAEERAQLIGQSLIDKKFHLKVYLPKKEDPLQSAPTLALAEAQGRGLASLETSSSIVQKKLSGEYGRDPWGRPFYYQVKGDGLTNSTLYIWSLGENGKPNFRDFKDLILQGVRGDDILVTMEF